MKNQPEYLILREKHFCGGSTWEQVDGYDNFQMAKDEMATWKSDEKENCRVANIELKKKKLPLDHPLRFQIMKKATFNKLKEANALLH